jgi:hypothetical protein
MRAAAVGRMYMTNKGATVGVVEATSVYVPTEGDSAGPRARFQLNPMFLERLANEAGQPVTSGPTVDESDFSVGGAETGDN